MKKDRLVSFDLIRFIATFSIVIFHFMINGKHIYPEKYLFFNYDLAQLGVSLFFILSGATLYYNSKENFSIKEYYVKRFKTIFPIFYVAYFCILLFVFWENPAILNGIKPYSIIFTLFGMDGLFNYKFSCLSLTGEWFLGAIIILYIIYPLLKSFINKYPYLFLITISLFFLILYNNYFLDMPVIYNPFIRILEFSFGLFFTKKILKSQFSYINFFVSFIILISMLYFPLPINQMYEIVIGGCSAFVFIFELGKLINSIKIKSFLSLCTKYSFSIFLVHHIIANYVSNHFGGNEYSIIEYFLITIIYLIFVVLFARLLNYITSNIMSFVRKFKTRLN